MTKLREWRRDEGFSLDEVSGITGISVPMLSMTERGLRQLSLRSKISIARRLGVPVRALFDVEDLEEALRA